MGGSRFLVGFFRAGFFAVTIRGALPLGFCGLELHAFGFRIYGWVF